MDLSDVLEVLHSSIAEKTKNKILKNSLDEDSYDRLIEWQRTCVIKEKKEESPESSQFRRGHGRFLTSEERASQQIGQKADCQTFERSFVVNSNCTSVVLGPNDHHIKDFQRRGVKMTVEDLDDGKINVTLRGRDQQTLTIAVLEIWKQIAKIQKRGERQLSGDHYQIASRWSEDQRANFSIRTGCSLTFMQRKPSGCMITLKAFSREEADAGFAQISAHDICGHTDDNQVGIYELEPLNMLLIGQEAVGKTTLINTFHHAMKLNPTARRDQDHLDEMPLIYSFNGVVGGQSREIRIIDTPEISSGGADNDWENIEAVVEAVKQLGKIHAVVLVINAVEDNLAQNFVRGLKNFLQRFHRDILRNVLLCVTRAAKKLLMDPRICNVVKQFTDEMAIQQDIDQFTTNRVFYFKNNSQPGIEMNFPHVSDFWTEQPTRFFKKVAQLPIFDAKLIVPTLKLKNSDQKEQEEKITEHLEALETTQSTVILSDDPCPFLADITNHAVKNVLMELLGNHKICDNARDPLLYRLMGEEVFKKYKKWREEKVAKSPERFLRLIDFDQIEAMVENYLKYKQMEEVEVVMKTYAPEEAYEQYVIWKSQQQE